MNGHNKRQSVRCTKKRCKHWNWKCDELCGRSSTCSGIIRIIVSIIITINAIIIIITINKKRIFHYIFMSNASTIGLEFSARNFLCVLHVLWDKCVKKRTTTIGIKSQKHCCLQCSPLAIHLIYINVFFMWVRGSVPFLYIIYECRRRLRCLYFLQWLLILVFFQTLCSFVSIKPQIPFISCSLLSALSLYVVSYSAWLIFFTVSSVIRKRGE